MSRRPQLVLLGRQGAGKGTQAARLAKHYDVPHLSTGEIFRSAVEKETRLGLEIKRYMDRGELVPDEVVLGVVRELFEHGDVHHGYIFDGFPRTVAQGVALDTIVREFGEGLDLVCDIDVPTDVVLHRLAGRRVCQDCGQNYHVDDPPTHPWICDICGGQVVQREDDTEEAISRRLALYEEETLPLTGMYREKGILVVVSGVGTPDQVFKRLTTAIDMATVAASS